MESQGTLTPSIQPDHNAKPGTSTPSTQPDHNSEPLSEVTRQGYKLTKFGCKEIIDKGNAIINAFWTHKKQPGNEIAINDENGLPCKIKPQWLGIIWLENKLLSASSDGTLFLYDNKLDKVCWSLPTGKPLHVSYENLDGEYDHSIVFTGGTRKAYRHPKGTNKIVGNGVLASEFVKNPYGYWSVEGYIVPSYSVITIIHVHPKTGERLSPLTLKEATTDSYSGEILCIRRFDYQLTCYKPGTDFVWWYERIASFDISIVGRDGGGLHEKNRQNLPTPTAWYCKEVGSDGTVQLDEYELGIDVIHIIKRPSDDDAVVRKIVDIVRVLSKGNLNVRKVYNVPVENCEGVYKVSTEQFYSDRGLREFIQSSSKDDKIAFKFIRGIVTGLIRLHDKGIYLRNLDIDDIFVDEHSNAKISAISQKTVFQTDDMLADMRADMLALGHIIFSILAGVGYTNEDWTKLEASDDNPEALDLLRKLLNEDPEKRPKALEEVWNHPLLWDSRKKLQFIWAVSEHLETNMNSPLSKEITDKGVGVFGAGWDDKVDVDLVNAVETNGVRPYTSKKFGDMYYLIRFIRNLISHQTRITNVINDMARVPLKVDDMHITMAPEIGSYFFSRFPKLVMVVYNTTKEKCGKEKKFGDYFNAALDN